MKNKAEMQPQPLYKPADDPREVPPDFIPDEDNEKNKKGRGNHESDLRRDFNRGGIEIGGPDIEI